MYIRFSACDLLIDSDCKVSAVKGIQRDEVEDANEDVDESE